MYTERLALHIVLYLYHRSNTCTYTFKCNLNQHFGLFLYKMKVIDEYTVYLVSY